MSNKIIIIGDLNKKLLLPLLLALGQIFFITANELFPKKTHNWPLLLSTFSLGHMSAKFIPCILTMSRRELPKEKQINKHKCLYYSLLCFIFLINTTTKMMPFAMDYTNDENNRQFKIFNPFFNGFFLKLALEIIFLIIFSIYLLKYKYFIHHYFSIIVFAIIGIITDMILGNYNGASNWDVLKIRIIMFSGSIVESLYYCYLKYLMDKFYYPYWDVTFIPGVFLFCISLITIIFSIIKKEGKENEPIPSMNSFLKASGIGIIIGKYLILVFLYVIICPLLTLNIYYFNPNFILIILQISNIIQNLFEKSFPKYYCIPLYLLQLFCLLVYLEIIEINICNFNKNTKRNISRRSLEDELKEDDANSTGSNENIDVDPDYSIKERDMNIGGKNPIPLSPIFDTEE